LTRQHVAGDREFIRCWSQVFERREPTGLEPATSGVEAEPGATPRDNQLPDTFRAGSELQRFRILAIDPVLAEERSREVQAVWVVESLDA
jgi:hypothetical protein